MRSAERVRMARVRRFVNVVEDSGSLTFGAGDL